MANEDKSALNHKAFTAAKFAFFDAITLDHELTPLDVRVAWRLVRYINHRTRKAWPSQGRLAREVGATERSVRRALKHLAELGWFRKVSGGGGRGLAAEYAPNLARIVSKTRTPTSGYEDETRTPVSTFSTENPDSNDLKPGHQSPKTRTPESAQTLKEIKKETDAPAPAPAPRAPAPTLEARKAWTAFLLDHLEPDDLRAFNERVGPAEAHQFLAEYIHGQGLDGEDRRQLELRLLRAIKGGKAEAVEADTTPMVAGSVA